MHQEARDRRDFEEIRRDFERARTQWRAQLVVPAAAADAPAVRRRLDAAEDTARRHLAAMCPPGERHAVWPDLPLRPRTSYADSERVAETARRTRALALAWASPGGALTGRPHVLAAVEHALAVLAGTVHSRTAAPYGNWYVWQVSAPAALNDVLVLTDGRTDPALRDELLAAQAHFIPDLPRTGTRAAAANRVLLCDSVGGRALLTGDAPLTAEVSRGLAGVLVHAEPEGPPPGLVDGTRDEAAFFAHDGFHRDGSFVQHGQFPYAGGYGAALLASLTAVSARTAGTRWAVDTSIAAEWVRTAFEPWLWRGAMMDTVRGRAAATAVDDRAAGTQVIAGLLRLLTCLPGASAETLAPLVKGVLAAALGEGGDLPAQLGPVDAALALGLLADASVPASPPSTGTRVFGAMDRVLHRTPHWAVAVAMHSVRMAGYETGTGENLAGWYTSDGAAYLHTRDREQFGGGFWRTVDAHRIPGTTVDTVPRAAVAVPWRTEYHNPDAFAGGVSAGEWGAAGLRLVAQPPSTLRARSSWFFFADAYVCLVSDIAVATDRCAATVIDNRRVTAASSGVLLADGTPRATARGAAETLDAPGWLHLDGVAGYVPLTAPRVAVRREVRTGRLAGISPLAAAAAGPHDEPHTAEYVTLTVPHGRGSTAAHCGWAVLPGAGAESTRRFAAEPPVRVVDLRSGVHAVRHVPSGRFAAVFFAAGASGPVGVDAPCAVAVEQTPRGLTVAVSDPTHELDRVRVRLAAAVTSTAVRDTGVDVRVEPGAVVLDVTVAGARGASRGVGFGAGSVPAW